jgi:hypothetical protein
VLLCTTLYLCLSAYFHELLFYLVSGDPKAASLALGALALGTFLTLFFWTIAVSAAADIALAAQVPAGWFHLRLRRQEWRLYAAYLRFLMLIAALIGVVALLSIAALPFARDSRTMVPAVILIVLVLGLWLTARAGFLMPPIVATTRGAILRAAWRKSLGHGWRIASLIAILLLPTVAVHAVSEFVLHAQGAVMPRNGQSLTDYARLAQMGLSTFAVFATVEAFLAVTLLAAGAVSFYRQLSNQSD